MTQQLFYLPIVGGSPKAAVSINPGGRFHGWLFVQNANGDWVSTQKLYEVTESDLGPTFEKLTAPPSVSEQEEEDAVELLLEQFPDGHPAIDELVAMRSVVSKFKSVFTEAGFVALLKVIGEKKKSGL